MFRTRFDAALLWWAACTVLLAAETICFASEFRLSHDSMAVVKALKVAADVLVIMMPYWLLPGRWRGLTLVPLWGMSLVYTADTLYMRFTGDCLPLSSAVQITNVDTPLLISTLHLLCCRDAVYLLCPLTATSLWCVRQIRHNVVRSAIPTGVRTTACAISTVVFILAQVAHSQAFARIFYFYNGSHMSLYESTDIRVFHRDAGFRSIHSSALTQSGIVVYMFTELFDALICERAITLTDSERRSLETFALHKEGSQCPTDKNIVFVIAESLNAEAIGRRIGNEDVTPTLDSLITAEGTLSCMHVVPQIRDGISADGQLLYNLGTLPMAQGVATQNAIYDKKLPTLAAQLAATHTAVAIFAERGITWKERDAYKAYGYERVLTSDSIRISEDMDAKGADVALMGYALNVVDGLTRPFFMQLLTVSTHYPFTEHAAPDFAATSPASGRERDYLRCVRYLDHAIGILIDGLRERHLLDNTIIVIASDHHMNMDSGLRPIKPIIFIAANCGHTLQIEHPVAQADIFPTVCALAGLHGPWRGVGRSLLDGACGAVDFYGNVYGTPEEGRTRCMHRAWGVSDSILRSDFFPKR